MDKALAKEKTKLINLYFGHDLTLVHVLRSLNLTEILKPGFAAYLLLESYSDRQLRVSTIKLISASAHGSKFEIVHFRSSTATLLRDQY